MVIFVLRIIWGRGGGDAMYYCELTLEEVVVLSIVFANYLWGRWRCCYVRVANRLWRGLQWLCSYCELYGRRGGDAMFYCELSSEGVVVLYLYLRIIFGDGGGDTMFVLQIFFEEVSSGYIRFANYMEGGEVM